MTIATTTHEEVDRFRALVADRLGLCFDDAKLGSLAETLRGRTEATGLPVDKYLRRFEDSDGSRGELRHLAQELTVAETYFFRGAEQLRAFIEVALPERLAAGVSPVRVLSAGCASGEEPYSLAIGVRQGLPSAADSVVITAVDVNPLVLEKAKRARYSSWSLRELPREAQARWFKAHGDAFVLDDTIRAAVSFGERNIVSDEPDLWQPRSFDIVFCRNVLMYFAPEQAGAVIARIERSLVPGGYLFLGHAETLRGLSNDFHLCHTHEAFYYQRKTGTSETKSAAASRNWAREVSAPPEATAAFVHFAESWVETVRRSTERIHALTERPTAAAPPQTPKAGRAPDLQVALQLMRSEHFERALELLSALPAEQTSDPDALLLRAALLTHSGALEAAERVCRQLLEADELSAGAHYLLALCREGAGDRRGALDHDQIAAYLDPAFAMARLHTGLLARRSGDRESALDELERALPLLQKEDASRLLMFGGGFGRDALVALCKAELAACGR